VAVITRLTKEQEARFPEFVAKWIRISLATGPSDRPAAEEAIGGLYDLAGLGRPKIFWLPCPISGALSACAFAHALTILKATKTPSEFSAVRTAVGTAVETAVGTAVGTAVETAVRTAVGTAVETAVGTAVETAVGTAVGTAVRTAVRTAVGTAVRTAVGTAVGTAVETAVGTAVETAVGTAVRTAVETAVRTAVETAVETAVRTAVETAVGTAVETAGFSFFTGHLWPGYPAWADFFLQVCDVKIDTRYHRFVETCGYTWLLEGICFTTEKPVCINRDANGRLHSPTGPSIAYPSGWALYHWHGAAVPQHVIDQPEKITVKEIESERNAEVRRVLLDRFGLPRYLRESGAVQSQRDDWGTIYRKPIAGDEDLVMVRVVNATAEPDGSKKEYWLRVPPNMETARQAVAWSFGREANEYRPRVET
jgi:hypothetical protein